MTDAGADKAQIIDFNYRFGWLPRPFEETHGRRCGIKRKNLPVIRVTTRHEHTDESAAYYIHGFLPYFYFWDHAKAFQGTRTLKAYLESQLITDYERDKYNDLEEHIEEIEAHGDCRFCGEFNPEDIDTDPNAFYALDYECRSIVAKRKIVDKATRSLEHIHTIDNVSDQHINYYGYHEEKLRRLYKVTCYKPSDVRKMREALHAHPIYKKLKPPPKGKPITFESNVDFIMRWAIDQGMYSGGWFQATKRYSPREMQTKELATTDHEYHVWYEDLKAIAVGSPEEPKQHTKVRVLSSDIEVYGIPGKFPKADDPVNKILMIADCAWTQGSSYKKPLCSVVHISKDLLRVIKPSKHRKASHDNWQDPRVQEEARCDGKTWIERGYYQQEAETEDANAKQLWDKTDPHYRESLKEFERGLKQSWKERGIEQCYIEALEIRVCQNEADLLLKWSEFFREEIDPDICTGWNTNAFDYPFLVDRASFLGVADDFCRLSRFSDIPAEIKRTQFHSKGLGNREIVTANLMGRVQMDMLEVIRREHKLRRYGLTFVAEKMLKRRKLDVHYTEISKMWDSDDAYDHLRLVIYCAVDAYLPLRIMQKLNKLTNLLEMARVSSVPPQMLLTRGQQIKVFSAILRKVREKGYVVPFIPMESENEGEQDDSVGYKGATVVKPKKGYYNRPIITLDFSSLYPSIMMAHNLGYITHLLDGLDSPYIKKYGWEKDKDYEISPEGDVFVKKHIRVSILSEILQEWLGARKVAKKQMFWAEAMQKSIDSALIHLSQHSNFTNDDLLAKLLEEADREAEEGDRERLIKVAHTLHDEINQYDGSIVTILNQSMERWTAEQSNQDGRQLSLKISANSVYGFTGATVGKLPDLGVAAAVTGFGRAGLQKTIDRVEGYAKGSELNPFGKNEVVYGDTDSIMVDCGFYVKTRQEIADELGAAPTKEEVEEARRKHVCEVVYQSILLGRKLQADINTLFEKPMNIEYEKSFCPYLLKACKRYGGLFWTSADHYSTTVKIRGYETARRDNCEMASDSQKKLFQYYLVDGDPDAAVDYARDLVGDLLSGNVPMNKLVISKEYSRKAEDYKGKQAHVELVGRMKDRIKKKRLEAIKAERGIDDLDELDARERDTVEFELLRAAAEGPRVGDRIDFVFVKDPTRSKKQYQLAECPDYLKEEFEEALEEAEGDEERTAELNKFGAMARVDFDYVLNKQLLKPWSSVIDIAQNDEGFVNDMFNRIKARGKDVGINSMFGVDHVRRTRVLNAPKVTYNPRKKMKHGKANLKKSVGRGGKAISAFFSKKTSDKEEEEEEKGGEPEAKRVRVDAAAEKEVVEEEDDGDSVDEDYAEDVWGMVRDTAYYD